VIIAATDRRRFGEGHPARQAEAADAHITFKVVEGRQ
jgi:hypothetical protein